MSRDLIPGRLGGRFIASHIVIPDGGPVPDLSTTSGPFPAHLLQCGLGRWSTRIRATVVMHSGDWIQPPHIRHRVLESR